MRFALPLGRGITGRVAAYDVMIAQDDYRDSTYRDSSISDLIDREQIRSPSELKMVLTHAIATAQKARREGYGEYLLDSYAFGLDSLMGNPRLVEDLSSFAARLLAPLIEHDAEKGSSLTFVLAQTLGSAQAVAEHLHVHINTIRNRLQRTKAILRIEQASPKNHAAMLLAAFIWKSQLEHPHP